MENHSGKAKRIWHLGDRIVQNTNTADYVELGTAVKSMYWSKGDVNHISWPTQM